jgi:hypothetical protein
MKSNHAWVHMCRVVARYYILPWRSGLLVSFPLIIEETTMGREIESHQGIGRSKIQVLYFSATVESVKSRWLGKSTYVGAVGRRTKKDPMLRSRVTYICTTPE